MYKIDGSELYEYQQQLSQPPEDIPIWEKKCLTVEEAAAYSGIGERRLKAVSYTHLDVYKRQPKYQPVLPFSVGYLALMERYRYLHRKV